MQGPFPDTFSSVMGKSGIAEGLLAQAPVYVVPLHSFCTCVKAGQTLHPTCFFTPGGRRPDPTHLGILNPLTLYHGLALVDAQPAVRE